MSAGLDVEAARKVLLDSLPPNNPKWRIWVDGVLERLEPCVIEDAPPVIDRDTLVSYLESAYPGVTAHHQAVADRILTLVRPVRGIEQDRIRRILLGSLPANREWVTWGEGVLARIFAEGDES